MIISILKNHIAHHTYSGEVEVSLDFCPPGSLPPGNFLAKYVDHFDTVLLEPTRPRKRRHYGELAGAAYRDIYRSPVKIRIVEPQRGEI